MYDYLKARSGLLMHYESAIYCKRETYDVGSEIYPSVKMVHDVGEKRRKQKRLNDRPNFMCEYAHAMGVGPGNTEAYWQEIYRYDSLIGGCVWEMVDPAVQAPPEGAL